MTTTNDAQVKWDVLSDPFGRHIYVTKQNEVECIVYYIRLAVNDQIVWTWHVGKDAIENPKSSGHANTKEQAQQEALTAARWLNSVSKQQAPVT